jgi:two-component system response regulator DesR
VRPGEIIAFLGPNGAGKTTARSGGSIADLARILHLSEGAVRNHLSAVIGKTGARNRADAARIAEQNGWL